MTITVHSPHRCAHDLDQNVTLPALELHSQTFRCRNILITVRECPEGQCDCHSDAFVEVLGQNGESLGSVGIEKVSDHALAPALESLESKVALLDGGTLPPDALAEFLGNLRCAAGGSCLEADATIARLIAHYAESLEESPEGKPRVPWYPLSPRSGAEATNRSAPIRWVTLLNPSKRLLDSVAETLGVSTSTAEMYLFKNQPPAFFQSRQGCFFVLDELVLDRQGRSIANQDICAILSRDYLVTMTKQHSPIVEQIRDEMKQGRLTDSENEYTNHLIGRILGCAIHRNLEVLNTFVARVAEFAEEQENKVPSADSRAELRSIVRGISAARQAITPTIQILHALREESTRYGAPIKDALQRYDALLKLSDGLIKQAQDQAKQVMDDWKLNQDNRRNDYQARWNLLAAWLGPTALGLGFIQAIGGGWSDITKWSVVGATVVVSIALHLGMKLRLPVTSRVTGEEL